MRINLILFLIISSIAPILAEKIPSKPFYFTRHGMTEWNVLGKQQGQTDIPLNGAGREQVKKLRSLTDTLAITHFCSSTLSRAYETMAILNSSRNLPEYRFDALKEQGKGALEGITEAEWKRLPKAKITAEIENKDTFRQRTESVLHKILSQPGTPCIVAHSNNLRCIGNLLGCPIKAIPHNVIWHFEPSLDGNTWKVTELKVA